MTFGLTAQGLSTPRLADLRDELNAKLRELFGTSIDLSDLSIEGQTIGIVAERFASAWELLEVLHGAIDAGKATGALLDALCALSLTFRRAATYGVVTLTLTGTPGTTVPGVSLASDGGDAKQFQTIGDAEIVAVDGWTSSTAYDEGDLVTTGDQVYVASQDVPDSIDEPTHTSRGGAALPGSPAAYWIWLGPGTGSVDKLARAVESGVIFAAAHALDVIDTPVVGWEGVVNQLDVTPGRAQQLDEDLRLTREAELAALGTSPADALRGRLLRVGLGTENPVTAATVFRNVTDTTDADGIPPHAIEALVQGGEDDDIRAALWASVAAGIRTHGNTPGFVTDSQGAEQSVKFSRPTEIPIYVSVTLTKDPDAYPEDGDDQVKEAIATYGDAQDCGRDVVASRIVGAIFAAVDGVLDVTAVLIDLVPGPVAATTIPISLRQLAVYDTTRVSVTSVDGVP